MKCPTCKKANLKKGRVDEPPIEVAGRYFTASLPAEICPNCGETLVSGDNLKRFELAIAAWFSANGVRTPLTFRFMRKALGLPAAELATLLDVAPETVSRWERGKLTVEHARSRCWPPWWPTRRRAATPPTGVSWRSRSPQSGHASP